MGDQPSPSQPPDETLSALAGPALAHDERGRDAFIPCSGCVMAPGSLNGSGRRALRSPRYGGIRP